MTDNLLINTRHLVIAALAILLVSSSSMAQSTPPASTDKPRIIQYLPPTYYGTSTPCSDTNAILFFGGISGLDQNKNEITAINCLSNDLQVNASNGDIWLGSMYPYGNSWSNYQPETGPALHFSARTGFNTDDIYFQRYNRTHDNSVLHLVLGDNALSPFVNGTPAQNIGDAFVIGAYDYTTPGIWYPRFTFTSNGQLGIGTQAPQATLDVNGGLKVAADQQAPFDATTGCDSNHGGALRFNSSSKQMEYCNESNWVSLVVPPNMVTVLPANFGNYQTYSAAIAKGGAIVYPDATNSGNCDSPLCQGLFAACTDNGALSQTAPNKDSNPAVYVPIISNTDCMKAGCMGIYAGQHQYSNLYMFQVRGDCPAGYTNPPCNNTSGNMNVLYSCFFSN